MTLRADEDEAYLGYRILDPDIWPRRADAELTLSLFQAICQRYGMPRGALRRAGFEGAADRAATAAAGHLSNMPLFDQKENFLAFPARFLSATPVASPAAASGAAYPERCRALRGQLLAHRKGQPVGDLVRECLFRQMGRGALGQASIAAELGFSERSLRRKLALEGSSFHGLLEECRRSHGLSLLTRSAHSLAEIAEELGYSDQTAFSRACSRWYGQGPSRLRSASSAALHRSPRRGRGVGLAAEGHGRDRRPEMARRRASQSPPAWNAFWTAGPKREGQAAGRDRPSAAIAFVCGPDPAIRPPPCPPLSRTVPAIGCPRDAPPALWRADIGPFPSLATVRSAPRMP